MLKLLFKTTAYYVIWQKFKKQILTILISILLIGLITIIYEDIFELMKINHKESVGVLLFFKWFLILVIIVFNVYILRKTKIDILEPMPNNNLYHSNKEEKIIKKKGELFTTSDLILKKYKKRI